MNNFGNTQAIKLLGSRFFFKMFKIWCDFENSTKYQEEVFYS